MKVVLERFSRWKAFFGRPPPGPSIAVSYATNFSRQTLCIANIETKLHPDSSQDAVVGAIRPTSVSNSNVELKLLFNN